MKKLSVLFAIFVMLSACETRDQSTLAGAAGGAALGAAVANDSGTGALIGAAAGALAGNYLGRDANNACIYERPDGSRYTAACPGASE